MVKTVKKKKIKVVKKPKFSIEARLTELEQDVQFAISLGFEIEHRLSEAAHILHSVD